MLVLLKLGVSFALKTVILITDTILTGLPGGRGYPGQRGSMGGRGSPGQQGSAGARGSPGVQGPPGGRGYPGVTVINQK